MTNSKVDKSRREKIAILRDIMAGRRDIFETLPSQELILVSTKRHSHPPYNIGSPCPGFAYHEPLTGRCWTKEMLEEYQEKYPQDKVTIIEIRRSVIVR